MELPKEYRSIDSVVSFNKILAYEGEPTSVKL
ncbi:hypothetical protein SAMN05216490_0983 [Mucilaginibacter mallensis]|uniref:Uncharacterized protein n=1 Tax=Mucilaginibacter mallensis TaxID=652787 RepID=A0A1H1RFA6_MUCMA|nr:hypothetical protein SAMN05216490_0983 [Mucilaginibacter mallensis]